MGPMSSVTGSPALAAHLVVTRDKSFSIDGQRSNSARRAGSFGRARLVETSVRGPESPPLSPPPPGSGFGASPFATRALFFLISFANRRLSVLVSGSPVAWLVGGGGGGFTASRLRRRLSFAFNLFAMAPMHAYIRRFPVIPNSVVPTGRSCQISVDLVKGARFDVIVVSG